MKCKLSLLLLSLVVVLGLAAAIGMGCDLADEGGCPGLCQNSAGNKKCDSVCNNAACNWDGGDCFATATPTVTGWCAPQCAWTRVGDGQCDTEWNCYQAACNYDDDDCATELNECSLGCAYFHIRDGKCQPTCNNAECNWDGGDCGAPTAAPTAKPTAAPTNSMSGYCSDRCMWEWVDDGQCDYEWHCYTASCNWDSGDCRSYYNECSLGCPSSQISNGTCEPTCNNAACNYDEGDCN